ncbi:hypothetical protein [Herbidospora sp. RD11066]
MSLPTRTVEVQFRPAIWEDVTPYLLAPASVQRGAVRVDSPIIRYEPGKATIRLNNSDRRFDPTHLSGPHTFLGETHVLPMKPIRLRAEWDSVTYDLFRGFVDQWDVSWFEPNYSITTVPATDAFKVLRNRKRSAVTPVGAGEDSGARVTRILDSVGWSAGLRLISTGDSTLQATTLEGDALDELQAVAESEIGELFVDAAGQVRFRNRRATLTESRSNTVQFTFGGSPGSPQPYTARLNTDDATLWNEVRAQRVGGTEQVVGDTASQTAFLPRTFPKNNLLVQTDTETRDWAGWILYVSKNPEVRFDSIEIHAHADPDTLFPVVLGGEIGDRIKIIKHPPGGGFQIEGELFIRGISHDIQQATWITTWYLQSAAKYGSFLVLGHVDLGRLNMNALAY